MSFFIAAIWSTSALLALDLIAAILVSARPSGSFDLVSRVLCQALAFVSTMFFMVVVHDKERPLSDVLGLRRPHLGLCLLACALGLALQGPMTLIANVIYSRYPLPDEELALLRELFDVKGIPQKAALVMAAGLVGPMVEEVFFRGGILSNLRKAHSSGFTLFGVSLLFAAAHRDWRAFLPDFIGGLAMGYVRIASGSLWPAVLVHATFNTTSVLFAVRAGPEADVLTRQQSLLATLATLVVMALYGMIARRSESCARARELDA
ncbi:MAG TPA: CPBP family intramembrane glutamic endopeptidase [Polyangiaceae bacterium]